MSLALRKEDFDLSPPAPALDWQKAFEVVNDLKDFERTITRADADMARWRAGMAQKLHNGFEKMEVAFRNVAIEEVRDFLFPLIDEAIEAVEKSQRSYAVPFHDREPSVLERISKVGGGPGRFLRKQINRMEDVRVKQFNAYTDFYYSLLAFRSKYEEGAKDGEVFDDPASLEAFLKSQVA